MYSCFIGRDPTKPLMFVIKVLGSKHEFQFKTSTEREAQEWYDFIGASIADSKGFREQIKAPESKEFWKLEQVTED